MRTEVRPLTAIRGIAALWVVLHHVVPLFWPEAPAAVAGALAMGYAGVDLFFILSGFILATVYRDLAPGDAPGFWLRRLLRVYPLHLCILAPIVLWQLVHTIRHGATLAWSALPASVFMVQSFFDPFTGWNAPSWSVGVELLCYAGFPLAIVALRRLRRVELAALVLLLAVLEMLVMRHHAGAVIGLGAVLRGLAGFGLGAALALLEARPARWAATAIECVGAAALLAGVALASAPLIALGSAALILGLSAETGPIARALSLAPLVWLGTISFSIYLLHAPLFALAARVRLAQAPLANVAVLLALLLLLSSATHRWIEQPGRRLARRLLRPRRRARNLAEAPPAGRAVQAGN